MIAIPKGNLCSHVMHFIPDKEVATPAGENNWPLFSQMIMEYKKMLDLLIQNK